MVQPVANRIAAAKSTNTSGTLIFPEDLASRGLGMLLSFSEYSYAAAKSNAAPNMRKNPKGAILLPLPQNLDDTVNIGLRTSDLENTGDAIARGINEGAQRLNSASDSGASAGQLASSAMEMLKNFGTVIPDGADVAAIVSSLITGGELPKGTADLTTFAARLLVDKFGSSNISKAFDAGTGTAFNPKTALVFDSVPLKRVSWAWTLAPTSSSESDVLAAIIKKLRINALPGTANVGELRKYLLTFPAIMEVRFLGLDENHFVKYKPMMIENISINYSPNGQAILAGGRPAAVQISISAMETDAWTREDVDGSNISSREISDLVRR